MKLPTIFEMSKDYLAIPAATFPAEHVAQSIGNQHGGGSQAPGPSITEVCQVLKNWFHTGRVRFMEEWVTPKEQPHCSRRHEPDLLAQLIHPNGRNVAGTIEAIIPLVMEEAEGVEGGSN